MEIKFDGSILTAIDPDDGTPLMTIQFGGSLAIFLTQEQQIKAAEAALDEAIRQYKEIARV